MMGLLDKTTASEWVDEETAAYDHHCPHKPGLNKIRSNRPAPSRPSSGRAGGTTAAAATAAQRFAQHQAHASRDAAGAAVRCARDTGDST